MIPLEDFTDEVLVMVMVMVMVINYHVNIAWFLYFQNVNYEFEHQSN